MIIRCWDRGQQDVEDFVDLDDAELARSATSLEAHGRHSAYILLAKVHV